MDSEAPARSFGRTLPPPPADLPEQDEGTLRMVAALQQIHRDASENPLPYIHMNSERADAFRQLLNAPGDYNFEIRLAFARELLYAGRTQAAIEELEKLVSASGNEITTQTTPLFDLLAVAYLRLGEEQNCLEDAAAEACILPLKGDGIHGKKEWSRRALEQYERLLAATPGDYQSRWLLNIAHTTLGEYPNKVPRRLRIEGLEQRSRPLIPRFSNQAPVLGVDVVGMSGGVSVEDFNNDGFLDIFTSGYGLDEQVRFFLNDGRGSFVDHTYTAGLHGVVSGLNVVHADYDNDGFVDIFILRGAWLGEHGAHPNSLLRNNGDGTFSDVTFAAGVLSYHPTQTAAWVDFNKDGLLDLFVGNETRAGWAQEVSFYGTAGGGERHPCELYLNNGDGTFTDVAADVGLDVSAFVKGATWADINNDGLPDLYLSISGENNRLYVNRGGSAATNWKFEEIGIRAGVGEPIFSFPVWFWDYNNDGWEDLLVLPLDLHRIDSVAAEVAREYLDLSTMTEKPKLYRNNGNETFSDVTAEAGLHNAVLYAMGANFGDLNNDGFPDFYVGTGSPDLRSVVPNRMFLNDGGRRFEDVTFDGGFGHLQKGHGVAFADFNRDGDQDIYAAMGGAVEGDVAANVLFENPGAGRKNTWVTLLLEGTSANRSAIGARIRIDVTGRGDMRRTFYSTVSTGGSFGASSLQVEMGLGAAVRIDTLRITWPTAERTVETHTGIPLRSHIRIVQGSSPQVLDRAPVATDS